MFNEPHINMLTVLLYVLYIYTGMQKNIELIISLICVVL